MSQQIRLHLFGPLRLSLDDVAQTAFRSNKTRALLAYLVLEGHQPILRSDLVDLLWHGYIQRTARASLRMALTNLRQLLGETNLLDITTHTVELRLDNVNLWCDAVLLDRLIADNAASTETNESIRQLYVGEFLAGLETIDSAPFVNWLLARRNRYDQRVKTLLSDLSPRLIRRHNLPRQLTPFIGRSAEINLLRSKVQDPNYPLITITGEGGIGKTRLALALAHSIHDLEPTPWANSMPGYQTRRFPDGIWYISLAGVTITAELREQISAILCGVLGILSTSTSTGSMTEKLLAYLQNKELWLIFDGADHLAGFADFVLELLQRSPTLHILVTSRQRLNLQAEFLLRLEGLPVPDSNQTKTWAGGQILDSPSVQLFYERARRVEPLLDLSSANREAIVRICHLLEGLPLAIELAAALVEKHTCPEISEALQKNFDILSTTLLDVPPRQRSIRAVMTHSWKFLSAELVILLQGCSIFHGGFSQVAANEIVGATVEQLQQLIDQSLLRQTEAGRFDMHELVRQFALEQLGQHPNQERLVRQAHLHYFANFLVEQQNNFQLDAISQQDIQVEMGNIAVAWQWGVEHNSSNLLSTFVRPLARFYALTGRHQEAAARNGAMINQLRKTWDEATLQSTDGQRLLALLLLERAYFAINLALPEQAESDTKEALQLAQATESADLEARGHVRLGDIAWARGDYAQHRLVHQQALRLARQSDQRSIQAHCLMNLGINYDMSEEYFSALDYYQSALLITEQLGDLHQENLLRNNIGVNHAMLGNYMQALQCYEVSERLSRQLGDLEGGGFVQLNLAILCDLLGDRSHAQQHGERALRVFRSIAQRRLEAQTLACLANIYLHQGEKKRATNTVQRALRIAREHGFQAAQAEATKVLADILSTQQRCDEAKVAYTEAATLWRKLGREHRALVADSGLVEVSLSQANYDAADEIVDLLANKALQPANYHPPFPGAVLLACYRVLEHKHDPRATKVLQHAVSILQSQLDTIQDSQLQQSFLENVPAHRTLLELTHTDTRGADLVKL